jgi:hypothetical protein
MANDKNQNQNEDKNERAIAEMRAAYDLFLEKIKAITKESHDKTNEILERIKNREIEKIREELKNI